MSCTRALGLVLLAIVVCGCTRRELTVRSEPPGALVYLNNQEVGRTPVTRSFTWYGNYDVSLRDESFDTLNTSAWVVAPFWEWPPIDFFAQFLPLQDHQTLVFKLERASTQPADAQVMLDRAAEMRAELQSSQHTRQPATQPRSSKK